MAHCAVFVVYIAPTKQAWGAIYTTNATRWVAFVLILNSELLTRLELVTSSLPKQTGQMAFNKLRKR